MLDSYAEQADNMPLLHRALVLAWAQEMNLPCKTLLKGLDEAIARRGTKDEDFSEEDIRDINDSLILDTPESPLADAVANVLTMTLLKKAQLKSTVMPQVQQYAWIKRQTAISRWRTRLCCSIAVVTLPRRPLF